MPSDAVPTVTQNDIIRGLREVGLRAGMAVQVHSSLKSFGRVEGGPGAVVAALMDVLTGDGTLMMPSFNHCRPFAEGEAGYYAPHETPTCNGAIPDAFWRMPGVARSLNPTHAFAAWGRHTVAWTEHHHRTLTTGPDSPLGRLCMAGGFILHIGIGMGGNTLHHVAETCLDVPCLGKRTEAYPVKLPDGRMVTGRSWGWRETPCPITDQRAYQPLAPAHMPSYRTAMVGNSELVLYRARECFDFVTDCLRNGLASLPPCSACPIRPRVDAHTVESDWDTENGCLRPDSEAWTY